MTPNKLFKTFRVTYAYAVRFANGETYAKGETRDIRASSMRMAGTQSTTCDGEDIANVELIAVNPMVRPVARVLVNSQVATVDLPRDRETARRVARLAGINTRRMQAFPARVAASYAIASHTPGSQVTARLTTARDSMVSFHIGGAF